MIVSQLGMGKLHETNLARPFASVCGPRCFPVSLAYSLSGSSSAVLQQMSHALAHDSRDVEDMGCATQIIG